MAIVSRLKVWLVQPPTDDVVMGEEVSAGKSRITASTTCLFGSNKTTCSLAFPPSVKKPSPVVGIAPLVQPQVFQFRSAWIELSILAQGKGIMSWPAIT